MKIKINKIISFSLMILGFSCVGYAQQESQFTQYMFNRLSFNPAYAGSSGSICATIMYRNQWLGLNLDSPTPDVDPGSTPVDYLFSFDMPVKFLHGGIGLYVQSDKIGYHNTISGAFDYAFRIYWGPGNLAAGIEANFANNTLDFSQLHGSSDLSGDYSNPISSSNDPLLNGDNQTSDFLFDLSTGVYYQVPGAYYFGISAKNLLASKSDVLNWKNARNIYLMGGYEYTIPANPSFKLKPSVLLKTADFSTIQAEASCLLDYQNLFWGGVTYRFQDAIAFLAGLNWQKMKVGVSYDLTTSRLGTFKQGLSAGTLELYLRYCFKVIIPPKPPSVYRNTRYLF
ncbi:MAG: PorP/SprF family type IX secretion system membrane protein [Bacteroidales bacterium]|nr:PorP/SprF family type IX secretion system membrane protein [Bacteroidales bacterium]